MTHLPGSLVRFKAVPGGPIATVGHCRLIGEVSYFSVAWTDDQGSFQTTEVPGHLLVKEGVRLLGRGLSPLI
jgi:hypothetical protein